MRIDRLFDRLVRPEVRLGRRVWPAYRVAVYTGVLLGVLTAGALAVRLGLSLLVTAATALCGVLLAVGFGLATKIVTGHERYTVYHYQLLVLAGAAGFLALLGRPVLPYLDLLALALAITQGCGRAGCLMAGCCHGRPHAWGVRYGRRHAAAGFPRWLVGVRLLPVQALESLALFAIGGVGIALALAAAPGGALVWYLVSYALCRFGLERLRGDAHRPELLGLSEAQWIALLSLAAVTAAEVAGLLPLRPWHLAAFALATLAAPLFRFRGDLLSRPRHLEELGETLERVRENAAARTLLPRLAPLVGKSAEVRVETTSLGLRISVGTIERAEGAVEHYALSRQGEPLEEEAVRAIAGWILKLRHPGSAGEIVPGPRGVFHLLVRPGGAA
jgi:hypothetical protein